MSSGPVPPQGPLTVSDVAMRLRALNSRLVRDGQRPEHQTIYLGITTDQAFYVAERLLRLDRELRRVSAADKRSVIDPSLGLAVAEEPEIMLPEAATEAPSRSMAAQPDKRAAAKAMAGRPDSPQSASLRLVASEEGSQHMWLEPVGYLVSLLASQPVTALVNAAALSGPVQWLRGYLSHDGKRGRDPLAGVSARQALELLKEYGAQPDALFGGHPDVEVPLRPDGHVIVTLPDGTRVAARRIVLHQQFADGGYQATVIE